MARSCTEREKETIKKNLLEACRRSWTQNGYKKTSVDELCGQAGISKGAFYLFFESKKRFFAKYCVPYRNSSIMRLLGCSKSRRISMGQQKS